MTQFYLPPTRLSTSEMNHICLYSPAAEHHRTLTVGWYLFSVPLRTGGWFGLGGLVNTEVVCPPKTVTHRSTLTTRYRVSAVCMQDWIE